MPNEIAAEYMAINTSTGTENDWEAFSALGTAILNQERVDQEAMNIGFEQFFNSEIARKWVDYNVSGQVNIHTLLPWLAMAVDGDPIVTEISANVFKYQFIPRYYENTLKTGSIRFGNPDNLGVWQTDGAVVSELSFSLSTASAEALTYDVSGMGKPWTFFGAASPPPRIRPRIHPLFVGTFVEAWLDPSSNEIGTTSIGSRLANVEHSITTGVTTKFLPQGLESNRGYTRTGRTKREFSTSFSLEHTSNSEINYYSNNTTVRLRVRYNSANLIKTGFPYYVQFDVVGKLHTFEWGELEGSNRTVDFEVIPMFTPGTEYAWAVEVQTGVAPPRFVSVAFDSGELG